jgi:hypothetical protein
LSELVYVEHDDSVSLNKSDKVERCNKIFTQLMIDSQSPQRSARTIRKLLTSKYL